MDYKKYTDQELVASLKEGDRTAYAEIYDRYQGLLYIFAYKRLRNREETKDYIHDLFVKLWTERESLSLSNNLPAYLYLALRNRILNAMDHQQIVNRYIDSFRDYATQIENEHTDYLVRSKELQAFIETEIASLHPRMRQVFELSRHRHLTRKEIAEQLGISEQTVKSHMHEALKILKAKLGPFYFLLFL